MTILAPVRLGYNLSTENWYRWRERTVGVKHSFPTCGPETNCGENATRGNTTRLRVRIRTRRAEVLRIAILVSDASENFTLYGRFEASASESDESLARPVVTPSFRFLDHFI
jgi:hypothetical protein